MSKWNAWAGSTPAPNLSPPKVERRRSSPYPQKVEEFADLDHVIRNYVLTHYPADTLLANPESVVVTQGSCFARNLAGSLTRLGMRVAHLNVNEFVNTTYANAQFFDHVFGLGNVDPHFRTAFERLLTREHAEDFRRLVAQCRAFVLTVGVAPCWYVKGTNEIVTGPDTRNLDAFEMRTTTPAWNGENLVRAVGAIRGVNPTARIFLTLSPAPLNGTLEFDSTIVADCLSKSVLRVAIHEVLQRKLEGVSYWPSFEIVRWVGSHLGPVFGAEDGHPRHVSNFVVDAIVGAFIRVHGGVPRPRADAEADFGSSEPFTLSKSF
jgi:hypothetical protein